MPQVSLWVSGKAQDIVTLFHLVMEVHYILFTSRIAVLMFGFWADYVMIQNLLVVTMREELLRE